MQGEKMHNGYIFLPESKLPLKLDRSSFPLPPFTPRFASFLCFRFCCFRKGPELIIVLIHKAGKKLFLQHSLVILASVQGFLKSQRCSLDVRKSAAFFDSEQITDSDVYQFAKPS